MKQLLYCFTLFSLLLSSCAIASSPDNSSIITPEPTFSPTVLPAATRPATATLIPTPTAVVEPTAASIPTSTPASVPTKPVCTNLAEVVRHLSVSDNTKMLPNVYFEKIWRVKNVGTCTWKPEYTFVFNKGDDFGSIHETPLNYEVKPGDTVDIQIALRTPMEPKTYTGEWMLRDQYGNLFGIGQFGNQPITARVVVVPIRTRERKDPLPCG